VCTKSERHDFLLETQAAHLSVVMRRRPLILSMICRYLFASSDCSYQKQGVTLSRSCIVVTMLLCHVASRITVVHNSMLSIAMRLACTSASLRRGWALLARFALACDYDAAETGPCGGQDWQEPRTWRASSAAIFRASSCIWVLGALSAMNSIRLMRA
jgi:hypothetical protein